MATDRIAVIWTRLGAQPVKMGTLAVTDTQSRFTYEPTYRKTGLPGIGLVYPPDAFSGTIVRERSAHFDVHPPIQAHIPQKSERNFQRALLQKYLESIHLRPKPGLDTDWEMLIRAGHGGIGHLDVFASDEAAIQWYSTPSKKGFFPLDDSFGFSLKEFMTWFDIEAGPLLDFLGPTPTLGGAIPKVALSIPKTGWDGRIALPSRFGDTDRTDIILKLENSNSYPGIIELEMLGLNMHEKAGFTVPRHQSVDIGGLKGLVVERFDRTEQCTPIFMESLYSILASGSKNITHHYSTSYDKIGAALQNPRIALVADRKEAINHLFERLIYSFLTGNGDLHLENLALLDRKGTIAFSPVYDPTPMRAYRIHNMLTPPGMTFGDYGDFPNDWKKDSAVDFSSATLRFIKALGISKKEALATIARLLNLSSDYPEQIQALRSLPEEHKANLIGIHQRIRKELENL